MQVPQQVEGSQDCGAYQAVFNSQVIKDPEGFERAAELNTKEGWREFLKIEEPQGDMGEARWCLEIRNEAAEMARKLATEMRTDLRSPSFNIPIPGQLRSSDDPMTLVDAKEALKILQKCKEDDDEEIREM